VSKKLNRRDAERERQVELNFLERVAKRIPRETWVLKPLGDLYTRCGEFEKGFQVDLNLTELCPREPEVWYNLGCSCALLGRKEDALIALEKAVKFGYTDADYMRRDADLASIQDDPEFERLVRGLEGTS
jgi:Flp pilus assembly protein TadD